MIAVHNNLSKQKLTKFVYASVILIILGILFAYKNWVKGFESPRQNTPNIGYTIRKDTSLEAVVSDLKYYDFIKDEYESCDRGCPDSNFNPELLQGGDLAPTMKQRYEWVKTYENCTKAIGHDEGQLSSEQYYQRTGIKKCVSPDGREFTKGKEG